MNVEQQIRLVTGEGFASTRGVCELGIPPLKLSDGPHGVRAQHSKDADNLGKNKSMESTCFPTGAAMASSWDIDLIAEIAEAIGEEAKLFDIAVMFGPAINIKRSPLCGRSFEYFSEDPYLSGSFAVAYVKAMQSTGVAACPKHFAANNKENYRMVSDSVVDERTLREIYFPHFEMAVKEAKPWTLMNAYNKLNGVYCSENVELLTNILRNEWGFDGAVISDYGSVSHRDKALLAGVDIEMPGTGVFSDTLVRDSLPFDDASKALEESANRVVKLYERTSKRESSSANLAKNHNLAQKAAEKCLVLLKNENNLLPISPNSSVAVIGELAKHPHYQGGGSSHVASWKVSLPWTCLQADSSASLTYSPGYSIDDGDVIDEKLLNEAVKAAKAASTVLLFAGLTDQYETEGVDRENMLMPPAHLELIERICSVNSNVVVVLNAGAPVEMPWINKVKSVLFAYTLGDGFGSAISNIIYGKANPSGKLAETLPISLKHTPAYLSFAEDKHTVRYGEGIFVGYRYYEAVERDVLYPFGHGLSYTSFEYSGIELSQEVLTEKDEQLDPLKVSVTVKNTGQYAGDEIVQLYVSDLQCSLPRPLKELKAFVKLSLSPGESKKACVELDRRSFAFYHPQTKNWEVEAGDFEILIGASSADIRCSQVVNIQTDSIRTLSVITEETTMGEIFDDNSTASLIEKYVENSPMFGAGTLATDRVLRNLPLWALNHIGGKEITPSELKDIVEELNNAYSLR